MALDDDILDQIRTSSVGGAMQMMLTEGVPEIGYDGDPFITLCYNKLEQRFEIWSTKFPEPQCVHRSQPWTNKKALPDIFQLCAHLRDHDLHKVAMSDILKRIDDQNAAVRKEANEVAFQSQCQALEKAYWHVEKEIGHLY